MIGASERQQRRIEELAVRRYQVACPEHGFLMTVTGAPETGQVVRIHERSYPETCWRKTIGMPKRPAWG